MDRSLSDDWLYDRVRLQLIETAGTVKLTYEWLSDSQPHFQTPVCGRREESLTHNAHACHGNLQTITYKH